MDNQSVKGCKKILWQQFLLGVLTLFFLPLHAEHSDYSTLTPLESNRNVSAIHLQQMNAQVLLLKHVQRQQETIYSQNFRIQPIYFTIQQDRVSQINQLPIRIRAGPFC